jgi:hypothetical protein
VYSYRHHYPLVLLALFLKLFWLLHWVDLLTLLLFQDEYGDEADGKETIKTLKTMEMTQKPSHANLVRNTPIGANPVTKAATLYIRQGSPISVALAVPEIGMGYFGKESCLFCQLRREGSSLLPKLLHPTRFKSRTEVEPYTRKSNTIALIISTHRDY